MPACRFRRWGVTPGGFVATAPFEGALAPFAVFLHLGEVVHVGKGTAFGLGKHRP